VLPFLLWSTQLYQEISIGVLAAGVLMLTFTLMARRKYKRVWIAGMKKHIPKNKSNN